MPPSSTRRQFLSGQALRSPEADATFAVPSAGDRIGLGHRAMACDFEIFLNPGGAEPIDAASAALDLVDQLEDQLTVYRPHSELSRLNACAASEPVTVEPRLFDLLREAVRLSVALDGAFDPTSGPLVALWRNCRQAGRIPTEDEVQEVLGRVGCRFVLFDVDRRTVCFTKPGVEFNLGAIGKGYAIDRAGELLTERGVKDFLMHAAASSILCRGGHNGREGWPVGLRNPIFPDELLGTLLVKDRGMSTSGNGIQFFRHEGRRYGHLLDPRTGWPVDELLSVTVLAPTATEAEALSTAFFVLGVEKARQYCHNRQDIGAILIPHPAGGKRLAPIILGVSAEEIFWQPNAEKSQ